MYVTRYISLPILREGFEQRIQRRRNTQGVEMKFSLCRLMENTYEIGMTLVWDEYEKYLCLCFFKIGVYVDFPCAEDE